MSVNRQSGAIDIPPMAYGAWAIGGAMWGGTDDKEAITALEASYDSGLKAFDTAPVYGFGHSEELIGRAMEGKPRESYQLFTKFGLRWDSKIGAYYFNTEDNHGKRVSIYKHAGKESVIWECEQSLRRLKTDYIDLYQLHWPDPETPIQDTMEALSKLLEEGKIRSAGVCNYSPPEVEEALKHVDLISNQVPYSMINRKIEDDVIPQAMEKNLSILAYSPLQRGLLTGKIKPGHRFGKGDTRKTNPFFKSDNIQRVNKILEAIKPIAETHNATLAQVVIHWTVKRPGIGCVLVGARNKKQLQDNIKALNIELDQEELNNIDTLTRDFELVK